MDKKPKIRKPPGAGGAAAVGLENPLLVGILFSVIIVFLTMSKLIGSTFRGAGCVSYRQSGRARNIQTFVTE